MRAAVLSVLLVGCSSAATMPPIGFDAARDASSVELDAGPLEVDAGQLDAGPLEVDAGQLDAGPLEADAGQLDAGPLEADAGPRDGGMRDPWDGEVCGRGACGCPAETWRCGDDCADVRTDERHCWACDNACPAGTFCSEVAGRCL